MSDFNPVFTPTSHSWNYSKSDKPNYSEILVGTVKAIQKIQAKNYTTGQPEFWPEGNPKFNIRLTLADPEGNLVTFTFQPAGKAAREGKKRSVHVDLWNLLGGADFINLIGKTIMISTKPGTYGPNNPRPFDVALVTDAGPYEYSGGELPEEYKVAEIVFERPTMTQPQQPPMQGQYYAPPVAAQPMPQQQPQQYGYAMQAQPMQQQQPMAQPMMQQPMQPQMPQGMDPNVAAAMQAMNPTNVQPVAQSVYDEGIPF